MSLVTRHESALTPADGASARSPFGGKMGIARRRAAKFKLCPIHGPLFALFVMLMTVASQPVHAQGEASFVSTFSLANRDRSLNQLREPNGRFRCPSGGTNYGSYFSGKQREALEALIQRSGVRKDRIIAVEQAGFENAASMLCSDHDGEIKQLLIWDPAFLDGLVRASGTKWAAIAVLAHELAHHLNNDTGQNPGVIPPSQRREQELYADNYAGQKLREFGASREEAVAVFLLVEEGGDTHPPSKQRVAAVGKGWDSGTRAGTQENDPEGMGTACVVSQFAYCWMSPMEPPLPIGAPCHCPTPGGLIPGIVR